MRQEIEDPAHLSMQANGHMTRSSEENFSLLHSDTVRKMKDASSLQDLRYIHKCIIYEYEETKNITYDQYLTLSSIPIAAMAIIYGRR